MNTRNQKLLEILKENFGYDQFRLEQENAINSILDNHDTICIMPTGGGKSVCYQVPALYLEGITLVISPLISLMQDQVMNLEENGINAVYLNSSLTYEEKDEAKKKILSGEIKLVYVSPEGILTGGLQNFFKKVKISLIAIDEAHCVSQWGHEFRGDYIRLNELKTLFPNVPTIALTATADEKTRLDIAKQLNLKSPRIFVSSFDRPNIRYLICQRSDELKQLDQFIKKNHPEDTGIVYCLSRKKVEKVTESLKKMGYPAVAYHAGLSSAVRTRGQKKFNRQDHVIVVATIAFGMGIDRPDVRFVAHLDLPKSIEGYYQETGRAGRDGKAATAWMIYGLQDMVKLAQMLETTDAIESYKKVARQKLDSMLALCETGQCRRKNLLNYFGEILPDDCGNCDTCLTAPIMVDATQDAQKLLSTIYRTNQIFGAGHIIDVLRGSLNQKITGRGHEKLSVFGIGKDRPAEYWNSLLRQLLHLNYIEIKNWDYKSLGLTQKTVIFLKQQEKFFMKEQKVSSSTKSKKPTRKIETSKNIEGPLFMALKNLRTELATQKGLPPYMIFSDKALHDMCQILPRNNHEFLMVHGVGQNKLENYGKKFLSLITEHHR